MKYSHDFQNRSLGLHISQGQPRFWPKQSTHFSDHNVDPLGSSSVNPLKDGIRSAAHHNGKKMRLFSAFLAPWRFFWAKTWKQNKVIWDKGYQMNSHPIKVWPWQHHWHRKRCAHEPTNKRAREKSFKNSPINPTHTLTRLNWRKSVGYWFLSVDSNCQSWRME